MYAREPKLVLIEFLVTSLAPQVDVAELVLEGAVLGEDGSVKMQEIVLKVATSLADGPVTNAEVRRELLLLEAAKVRSEVLEDQRNGNYDVAAEKMRLMSQKLRAAGLDDSTVNEEAADLELMADQSTPATWGVAESKYMYQRAYDSTRAMRSKMEHIARTRRKKPEADA